MKLLLTNVRTGRAHRTDRAATGARTDHAPATGHDDTLGRGMDVALTLLVFLVLGWLLDTWLGLFPVFTIVLVVFAAAGSFIRMKYVYDEAMQRHEADLRAGRSAPADRRTERPLDQSGDAP